MDQFRGRNTSHPSVRVAIEDHWKPIEFVDGEGAFNGLGLNIMQLAGRYLNISIQPVAASVLKDTTELHQADVEPFLEGTPPENGPRPGRSYPCCNKELPPV